MKIHITCHPPHSYYIDVSLLGLPAYVEEDDDITQALKQFGEIKGEVIPLKYKADHDLTGLENGNRLVKMVLSGPAIPYSMKISGEWCRVFHNNQRVCSNYFAVDHSRRNCPEITCHNCHEKGHLAFNCPSRTTSQENNTAKTSTSNEQDNQPENLDPASERQ